MQSNWRVVWITGASTGIGRALARQLATEGVIVAASARNSDALNNLGSTIKPYPLDVTDAKAVATTHAQIERDLGPIDLVICAAGRFTPLELNHFDLENFTSTMAVNYMGTVNVLAAILPGMRARKSGHISWIASVAGYRGLPRSAAYGPTKAALINLAECLAPELARDGITVSLINPGFVATPMTAQNDFPMPLIMSPETAATKIIAGLKQKTWEIAFPLRLVATLKLARLLPASLYFRIIEKFILPKS
jgi:short-subunit dehydrogenase